MFLQIIIVLKSVYLTLDMKIVSCNFQQKTELMIKIGFLDLRELAVARQNDIMYLLV